MSSETLFIYLVISKSTALADFRLGIFPCTIYQHIVSLFSRVYCCLHLFSLSLVSSLSYQVVKKFPEAILSTDVTKRHKHSKMANLLDLSDELLLQITTAPVPNSLPKLHLKPILHPKDLYNLMRSARRLRGVAEDALYAFDKLYEGSYAVRWAAEHGVLATLETAHHYELDLDRTLKNKQSGLLGKRIIVSPLQVAIHHGQDAVVHWLIDHGANVNQHAAPLCHCYGATLNWVSHTPGSQTTPECGTAIHLALCTRNESIVILLLSRGVSLELIESDAEQYGLPAFLGQVNKHVLVDALIRGLKRVVIHIARDLQFDLHAFDADGGVMMYAAQNPDDDDSVVQLLLSWGFDANGSIQNDWRSSPIYMAIRDRNLRIIDTLLGAGAVVGRDRTGPDGAQVKGWKPSPLSDCLSPILRWGSRSREWTSQQRRKLVRDLIAAGADIDEQNGSVEDPRPGLPLLNTIKGDELEDMETILRAGAKVNMSHTYEACIIGNVKYSLGCIKLLMEYRDKAADKAPLVKLLGSRSWRGAHEKIFQVIKKSVSQH